MVAPPSRRQLYSRPARCRRYEDSSLCDASLSRCFLEEEPRTSNPEVHATRYSLFPTPYSYSYSLFPISYFLFPTAAFIIHEGRKTAAKADALIADIGGTTEVVPFHKSRRTASQLVPFLLKPGSEHSFAGGHTMPFPYSLLPTRYSLLPTPYFLLPTSYFLLPSTRKRG